MGLLALVLVSCARSPTLLLLNFPEPDGAAAGLLQNVDVVDDRASENVLIKAPAGDIRYRLFPDAAAALRLYVVDRLTQVPQFALWLMNSNGTITVRIEAMSGVAETRRGPDIMMRYHISAGVGQPGIKTVNCRLASLTGSASGDPDIVLAADIEDNLRQCAKSIVQDLVRETAPLRPLPIELLPQITS